MAAVVIGETPCRAQRGGTFLVVGTMINGLGAGGASISPPPAVSRVAGHVACFGFLLFF
jgi:hypothetical protein